MLRRFVAPICLVLFLIGCQSRSSEPVAPAKDSAVFTMPVPEKLSKEQLDQYHSQLSGLLDRQLINRNFNGAVLIAKGGNILYEQYAGFTNPKTKATPITDSSAFHLASTSKPFTGMSILKLVQEGKIGLDDDIVRFFPNFPYAGVTVKSLLSHRSGLPNYLYFMDDKEKWPARQMVTNNDVLNFLEQYKPDLNYRTGSRFNYCNTNYVLLALIIEKVTGTPYPEYIHETIYKPSGMKHTLC